MKFNLSSSKNTIFIFIVWLAGGLLLSLPTLINGFPLIYFDSGFYFLMGFFDIEPWRILWRPISYGLLIGRYLKIGGQLSGFIILQNLIMSGFLYYFCQKTLGNKFRPWMLIVIIFILFTTPLLPIVNFILPDFFSGLLPLLIGCLLLEQSLKKRAVLSFFSLCAAIMHHSNMIASVIFLPILLLRKGISKATKKVLLAVILLPFLVVPVIHGLKTQNFSVSNAGHAILFSRFMAFGIAQQYLHETCANEQTSPLCKYSHSEFNLWNWANSSFEKRDLNSPDNGIDRFKEINWGILSSKFLFYYFYEGIQRTGHQIFTNVELLVVPLQSPLVETEIRNLNQNLFLQFKSQKLTPKFYQKYQRPLEYIYNRTILYSFIFLLMLFAMGRLHPSIQTLFFVCTVYYVCNAITIGFLTDTMPRYSSRVSWVFCFLFLLQTIHLMTEETNNTKGT